MDDPSVIVIGAGIAGLSAGIFAQRNGYESRIFEHHARAGGVAAAWDRGRYVIDGGIHFSMAHAPGTAIYDLYEQLGIVPANRFTPLRTYGRYLDEASGWRMDVTTDLDRFGADLTALSPSDGALAEDLVRAARAMQGLDLSEFGMAKPPEFMGPLDGLREIWSARRMWRHMAGRFAGTVADYARDAHDPRVRAVLENLFLPGVPVWFAAMILALLADEQLAFLEGGCRDFVGAMEDRYVALGGAVTYEATVAEILVEGDRAVGVRLADGSVARAGAVISAADGRSTIFEMLSGRYVDEAIRERYDTWPVFEPMVLASYGVARTFPDDPAFVTIALEEPRSVAGRPVGTLFLRLCNYTERFAPRGKTVVQAEFASPWDPWLALYESDRDAYVAEKERLADAVLAVLERHWPGVSGQVEVVDVATPVTTWRTTRNHRGAWEGWLPTPRALRTRVRRTLPGLGRFYMAGQWVMPGGGVPPCLYAGRHAVEILCRDDGRPFAAADVSRPRRAPRRPPARRGRPRR